MGTTYTKIVRFLGSPLFFGLSLLSFIIQAGWIAISSRYPMAFDEAYHFGLIKLQATQLSPIFTHQPPGPAAYGAITRDPSYLYHWLMSFPYRLFLHLTPNFMYQIIGLRLIDVVLCAFGIYLFWRVLKRTRASKALINAALLFFILTPVTTLLAAHINYDNLLIPAIAGSLLLLLRLREDWLSKHRFNSRTFLALIIVCCLASLVKFPFLPIFAGIAAYLLFLFMPRLRQPKKLSLMKAWQRDWAKTPHWQQGLLLVGLVISSGLFMYTYGLDLVLYHNLTPQCGQVLGAARCQTYSPWARNYHAAQHIINSPNVFYFIFNWIGGMFERLFFVINGSTGPAVYQNYLAPLFAGMATLGGVIGLFLYFKQGRRNLEQDHVLAILLFVMFVYIAALWGRNYHDYVHLGEMVAINGRYFVPVILPFYVAAGVGWQHWLSGRSRLKFYLLVAALVLCIEGGGITSYLAYSNQYWYWPNDRFVLSINQNMQKIVKRIVWAPRIH